MPQIYFKGQINDKGQPDGIVRAFNEDSHVYEGNMTPDGKCHGFGIWYYNEFIKIGWRKNDKRCGNGMDINNKTFEIT